MCLGVPGRVVGTWDRDGIRMARVDFGGVTKEVCLEYLPTVEVGDYTIVHVGFAISRLDEASAVETLRLFEQIGALDEELRPEPAPAGPAAAVSAPRRSPPESPSPESSPPESPPPESPR